MFNTPSGYARALRGLSWLLRERPELMLGGREGAFLISGDGVPTVSVLVLL